LPNTAGILLNSPEKEFPFMIGMDLVIAMPISWLPLVADCIPFARDQKSCFWGTWIGYFLVSPGCTCWAWLPPGHEIPDPSGVVANLMVSSAGPSRPF
jgi:hypothetical protein